MPFSYHDTVNENGETLDNYEAKAQTQEEIILAFFRQNPGIHFTPFQILEQCTFTKHEALFRKDIKPPITSVRRAITNLEHSFRGQEFGIKKSEKKKKGDYGRDNLTWFYAPQRIQAKLFL